MSQSENRTSQAIYEEAQSEKKRIGTPGYRQAIAEKYQKMEEALQRAKEQLWECHSYGNPDDETWMDGEAIAYRACRDALAFDPLSTPPSPHGK